ncbi:MAG: sulfatase [Acidobacteria bacterium]|nr:MAG: sulfatase [Acidobacteriota bacterium]
MDLKKELELTLTRRQLFGRASAGIGIAALASLLDPGLFAAAGNEANRDAKTGGLLGLPHFTPKAKRVIFLHQSGAPSQLDLFDYKPKLLTYHGSQLPDSVRMGQRITGMTSGQGALPVTASIFKFGQHGQSGAWLSDLLPWTAKIVDDITIIKTMNTEAINHDPAITFIQTGSQQPGRPSLGSWVSYGLGSENQNLPAFVVLISQANALNTDQPLFSRLWSSGFLNSSYQGVRFRAGGEPVLYLADPPGVAKTTRRQMLDAVAKLNKIKADSYGDPEIETRIAQYEMAYRMQTSVPELMDLSKEPDHTYKLYGEDARKPGTYAANCLLARRLAERNVRFIQLYHRGWDQHNDLPRDLALQCKGTDQASAALIQDLKQRGLLEDTLVVWGGEFGRTVYCQGKLTENNYGRDHHPRCFAMWLAGGGIKRGFTFGETDDYCYNVVSDPVHVHDLQATILHCLGVDHKQLTFKFQGRHFRLTDVHGEVVKKILA